MVARETVRDTEALLYLPRNRIKMNHGQLYGHEHSSKCADSMRSADTTETADGPDSTVNTISVIPSSGCVVGDTSETISPTYDPNLAMCMKDGVFGNYNPLRSELAEKATFGEFGSTKLPYLPVIRQRTALKFGG